MNYDIIFDNAIGLYVVKTSGKMIGEGFVDMAKGLLGHSRWVPGMSVVFDHTELDFSEVSIIDLEAIRNFHTENENRIGSGKSAIIVKPGFSRKWHMLWSHGKKIQTANKVQVFEDFKDGLQWMR